MRTLLATLVLALALLAGAGTTALASAAAPAPAPALLPSPVHGIYEVPTGTLTVRQDGTAHYVPSAAPHMGTCWSNDERTVLACAPSTDPDGNHLVEVWEDGSATYVDSPWSFDPETGQFTADQGA